MTIDKLSFDNESELAQFCERYMKEKQEYNGWSNYATWRINLEIVNEYDWQALNDSIEDLDEENITSMVELADYIQDMAENYIQDGEVETKHDFMGDYAMAFLLGVNWYEIAEHVAEDYPLIIKKNITT